MWVSNESLGDVVNSYNYYDLVSEDAMFDESICNNATGNIFSPENALNPSGSKTTWYQTFNTRDESALPRPSRLGYVFAGWEELQANGKWKATASTNNGNVIRYLRATWKKVQ